MSVAPKAGVEAAKQTREPRPVFIVGMQRSGTTMLRLMLDAHPNIAIPFESDFIPKFYRRLAEFGTLSTPGNVAKLLNAISDNAFVKDGKLIRDQGRILDRHPTTFSELINAIYSDYAAGEGKSRWGDKDPDYVTELDVIRKLFPDCQVIHIVRDGRAVANSLRRLDWGSKNLLKLAREWSWRVTLGHKMGMMLDAGQYLEIRYEDLVRTPETVLRRICGFLGERFDHRMLSYPDHAADALPESGLKFHMNSIRAPDAAKADAWQREMSLADRILFDEVAGRTLEEFGYPREERRSAWRSVLMKLRYILVDRW